MADIEQQLRAAMRAAVDAEEPSPRALIAAVRRRSRRRSMLHACVAVLVAVAVAIPTLIVVHRVVAGPAPATQSHLPTSLRGLPLPAGTDLQFLVSAAPSLTTVDEGAPALQGQARPQAGWYSTTSRTTTPITGLSSLASGDFVAFGRAQGGTWASAGCIRFCPDTDYYFIADGSDTATRIGAGEPDFGVVASGKSGAVWLVSYPPGPVNFSKEAGTARLVSTSGQPLGPQYHLPTGWELTAAVGRYLLLRDFNVKNTVKAAFSYLLWDPSARRVVRTIENAMAASHDWIAWTRGCRGCNVQILNVATGKSVATGLPAGPQPPWGLNGTFSDNGQLLAYRTPTGAVDVYGVRTGLLMVIPAVGASEWLLVGWLNGGPTLMIAAGSASGRNRLRPRPPAQFAIWRPGDTALRVATVKSQADVYALILWVTGNSIVNQP
jgi:hypothetical protein